MDIDRRRAFLMALAIAGVSTPGLAGAQQPFDFDPVFTAKLRAGEIARQITASPRDPSDPESRRNVSDRRNTAGKFVLRWNGLRFRQSNPSPPGTKMRRFHSWEVQAYGCNVSMQALLGTSR